MLFGVPPVQTSIKLRLKSDHETIATWEAILALIFGRFWWVLGPKLGIKIDPRRYEIQQKSDPAVKLKKSIWNHKAPGGLDLGAVMG